MKTNYEIRYAAHPEDAKHYDTARIRRDFLIEKVFSDNEVNIVYSMYDRMVVGGARPVGEVLKLEAIEPLKAPYFLTRREMGIFNVGGPGVVKAGDAVFELDYKEALYLGSGDREVTFESKDAAHPAKFYFNSLTAHRNYPDRKVGQFIEIHKSTVADQFVNFPKPQDMGNHEDVRWCALTDKAGKGAIFIATNRLSTSALQYSALDMILAGHPYQLPKAGDTYLHLDLAVTGLGGNSCGQGGPLMHDRVFAGQNNIGFIIRPAAQDLSAAAQVAPAGDIPLTITRGRTGMVELSSIDKDAAILYTINKGKKAKQYTEPISMRDGGTVTAWFANNPSIKTTTTFKKLETIQTEVIYASSEEVGDGDAKNLVDGDPATYWHSMYSVTVAKYPHWVDLDAGEVKTIKGFTYMPRQDSYNGNVKEYTIHVSMDGKNWGEPVQKGKFAGNRDEKKVIFSQPVKGRYIRFTALSEQYGQDYASGAELTILAE